MKFIDGIPEIEYVGEHEVAEIQKLSTIAVCAFFQENLHQFRADVMRLMQKHEAIDPDGSWLVFDHAEEESEGPVLLCPRVDICVATKTIETESNKNLPNQNIRIILNEAYTFDKGTEYFVIDSIACNGQ